MTQTFKLNTYAAFMINMLFDGLYSLRLELHIRYHVLNWI